MPTVPLAEVALVIVGALRAVWPVPDRLITNEEGVAFVARVIAPVVEPGEDGSNVALNVMLLPAGIIVDVVRPFRPKPAPPATIWEKVRDVFPLFFRVTCFELTVPSVTVPNATVAGVAAICACKPVPLNAMVAGEFGALLVIEMLPGVLPPAVGVNVTVKVVLEPALIEVGCRLIP